MVPDRYILFICDQARDDRISRGVAKVRVERAPCIVVDIRDEIEQGCRFLWISPGFIPSPFRIDGVGHEYLGGIAEPKYWCGEQLVQSVCRKGATRRLAQAVAKFDVKKYSLHTHQLKKSRHRGEDHRR